MENMSCLCKSHQLLTAAEVASILKVSKSFVYQLMQQGRLRTVIINRAKRVRSTDLISFIDASLSPSPDFSLDR